MKPLTCEMCGSTDLLKQDGVFVCQSCGVKYSVEEARKMMAGDGPVEVFGTVAIDNSKDAEKYLNLARTAATGSNHEEALSYANKVLEIDDSNWEAYFIKGTAAAWTSKLGHNNFDDATVCWSTAIALAPDEEALGVTENCMQEMRNAYTAMLSLRLSTAERALDGDRVSNCASELAALKRQNLNNKMVILLAAGKKGLADKFDISQGLGVVPLAQFNKNVSACAKHACESIKIWTGSQSLGSGARDAVGAVAMHETIIPWLDGKDKLSACSTLESAYNQISSSLRQAQFDSSSMNTFYSSLRSTKSDIQEENRKKAQEEAEEKRRKQEEQAKAYWEEHPEEKSEIEREKSELLATSKKIEDEYKATRGELAREKNEFPLRKIISEYEKELRRAQDELNRLGRSKGGEKQILNQAIADVTAKKTLAETEMRESLSYIEKRMDSAEAEKDSMINACNSRIGDLKHALSMGKSPKQKSDAIKELLRFDELREERTRKEEAERQKWAAIKAEDERKVAIKTEEEQERQRLVASRLKEVAEKRAAAKIRRRRRALAIIIPIVTVIVACVVAYFVTFFMANRYANEQKFTEARKWIIVESLVDLQDPKLVPYIDAGVLFEENRYGEAKDSFYEVGSYKNTWGLFYMSNYLYAEQLIEKGEYYSAIVELEYLAREKYKDSAVRLLEMKYLYAEQLIAEKNYATAFDILESLAKVNYEKAAILLYETKYLYAEQLIAKKDYDAAGDILESLADVQYEDSVTLLYETKCLHAEQLVKTGKYTAAVNELSDLAKRGYEGAEVLVQKTRYEGASYYCSKKDYTSARDLIKPLVGSNYAGAKELEQKIRLGEAQQYISRRRYHYFTKGIKELEALKKEGYKPAADALSSAKKDIYAYAQEQYRKKTTSLASAAFEAIESYKRSADYLTLIDAHSQKADIKELWAIRDLEDASELLLTHHYLCQFLVGNWETKSGGYYFEMEKDVNGYNYYSSYNLPWEHSGTFSIEKGVYILTDNKGKEHNGFRFSIKNWDTIEVFCYKNNSTHTLYRQ